MKPNWKDAPTWAKYLCQDEDETWTWYEWPPFYKNGMWLTSNGGGRGTTAFPVKVKPEDSLEEKPEGGV